MASAKQNTKFVEKVVTKIEKAEVPDGVTLTLNNDEAKALAAVLRKVGGTPETSRRGLTAAILEALRGAEVPMGQTMQDDLTGSLIFD